MADIKALEYSTMKVSEQQAESSSVDLRKRFAFGQVRVI